MKVNGISWSFHVDSPTQITATPPSTASSGPVSITNAGGTTSTVSNNRIKPKVTSFSPTSGAAGSTVIVNGTGLSGMGTVRFGGVLGTVLSSTATQAKVTVPPTAPVGRSW